jgi:streptogramin lyase
MDYADTGYGSLFNMPVTSRRMSRPVVVALGTLLSIIAPSRGQQIIEFPIAPGTPANPLAVGEGLANGPDGNVWLAETAIYRFIHQGIFIAGPVARVTDAGGVTDVSCAYYNGVAGSEINSIATGPDGNLWITEDGSNHLLTRCVSGVGGSSTPLPGAATSLITGPDGNLWFGLPLSVPPQIGRSTTTGVVTTFPLPDQTDLDEIAAGPDGKIWFTDTANNKVGSMTTGGLVTVFDVPTSDALPGAIAAGPDGKVWFVEGNVNQIGRITTGGQITEFPIPTPASFSHSIAAGADGAMWFTEGAGKIGRVTTSGVFSEFPVPYPGSSPERILGKPDGTVWFTDQRTDASLWIGRLGCVSDPQILCLDVGAFSLTASFQSTQSGPIAPATDVPLTTNTGYFWFFDPANVEMIVKVLDGCSINGHYWVFAGGMTNVRVEWKVTRSQTNAVKSYSNPSGTPFQPVQDTEAFPCP